MGGVSLSGLLLPLCLDWFVAEMSVVLAKEGCKQASLNIMGKILFPSDGEHLLLILSSPAE